MLAFVERHAGTDFFFGIMERIYCPALAAFLPRLPVHCLEQGSRAAGQQCFGDIQHTLKARNGYSHRASSEKGGNMFKLRDLGSLASLLS